ncbi:ribosomal-processing cysteine protease Prp [Lactobacillus terrae]|uniref:ribosomal-processing cysteine protease Prp n=1 Tax=Lactobacillus terrae TaxID=2269374 RepID=UPI000C1B668D|nr:ribosomal-processing cysteine protease Prp [Lactobacillus terrae]
MIIAKFHQNNLDQYDSFIITGHAESGPYGQDLVCAAVSAISIGTMNNLEKLTKSQFQVVLDEVNGGHLGCQITSEVSHDTSLLLENLYYILVDIQDSYQDNIKVSVTDDTIKFD